MKITKEQARENRLDVLEGRARLAELIEKHLPKFKWVKCELGSFGGRCFNTRVGKTDIHIEENDVALVYVGGKNSKVTLTEGTYERVATHAPYEKVVYDAICALEEL